MKTLSPETQAFKDGYDDGLNGVGRPNPYDFFDQPEQFRRYVMGFHNGQLLREHDNKLKEQSDG